jgi:kynureninase
MSFSSSAPLDRAACLALDLADPLAGLRDLFVLNAGEIYLNGNSLGALPRATSARVAHLIEAEWGRSQTGGWAAWDWAGAAARVGDKIARLVGAAPDEVIAADSTSLNLYKVVWAALGIARARPGAAGRTRILSERGNFPSDLYIAAELARQHGLEFIQADSAGIIDALDERVAVAVLSHVDYRSGRMHDLAAVTAAAHRAGVLVVWDLAHSAGAVPIHLNAAGADFAVGCGYKYFNGGPGAPAFAWSHARHADTVRQPLTGWMSHAQPYAYAEHYESAPGAARYLCGASPLLSLIALECGVETLLAAEPLGGMAALRHKSEALMRIFLGRVATADESGRLTLLTPADPAARGAHAALRCAGDAPGLVAALKAHGVVCDLRAPDVLRFALPALYTRHIDAYDAASLLCRLL